MKYTLTQNAYGKSVVRLTKVVRQDARHTLFEIDAAVQLEGDFAAAYTDGDNSKAIATDSMKNTVYVLAKENDFKSVEEFAAVLANHFVTTYPQVTRATAELKQDSWLRMTPAGGLGDGHDHAFVAGSATQRYAKAVASKAAPATLVGGVRGLKVLKTTNSQWHTFVADRYRTLKDSFDRILSTQVDADWTFTTTPPDFDAATHAIHAGILDAFAGHFSLGVQQTLLEMGKAALDACPQVGAISFSLPNLHRIPFNLEPFGLPNDNTVFVATDEPHGMISGTVTREDA